MIHWYLSAPEATARDEDWQESMKSIEGEDTIEAFPPECPQGAARVGEIGLEGRLARRPGDAGGDLAHQGVLPVHTVAADEVDFAHHPEHPGQLSWVVLKVTIKGAEQGGGAAVDAGPDRRTLAPVLGVTQSADPGVRPLGRSNPGPGVVGAGIINQDDFPRAFLGGEDSDQFIDERLDVVGLVEEWDDDGDFSGHRRKARSFPRRR